MVPKPTLSLLTHFSKVIFINPGGASCSKASEPISANMCSVAKCRLCVHLSVCLFFMESDGKISVLVMLLHMLCLLSVWPYSASRFQALFGMQVSSVEKLNTKTNNCLLPTHTFLSSHFILFRGSWLWDELRSVVSPETSAGSARRGLGIRAVGPVRGASVSVPRESLSETKLFLSQGISLSF